MIDETKPPKGWCWALRRARPPAEVGMVASSTRVVREDDSSGRDALNGIPLAEAHRIARDEAQPYIVEAVERLRTALVDAEGDARVLAHAYEHDSRPPPAVVARALAYDAGRNRDRWKP